MIECHLVCDGKVDRETDQLTTVGIPAKKCAGARERWWINRPVSAYDVPRRRRFGREEETKVDPIFPLVHIVAFELDWLDIIIEISTSVSELSSGFTSIAGKISKLPFCDVLPVFLAAKTGLLNSAIASIIAPKMRLLKLVSPMSVFSSKR